MKKTLILQITNLIEQTFDVEGIDLSQKIIVFPCGDIGIQTIDVLKNIYAIEPAYLIDNHKCKFSSNIHDISFLKELDAANYVLLLTSTNPEIYLSLRKQVLEYFPEKNVLELETMRESMKTNPLSFFRTKVGRHSYGPLCKNNDMMIESIGSFCSFAAGTAVVANHAMEYITTHPIIYAGVGFEGIDFEYDFYKDEPWYLPGLKPKPVVKRNGRLTIGNDVWLGRNVIITNQANIGNGVIAAAGAVITKDVPDYAVVAGVPARIIRYRYTPEQIEELNKIAWWDWSDDEIRKRHADFYLPIDEYIKKYKSEKN